MTSRERVQAAFRHEEPDSTPIFERLIKPPTDAAILGRTPKHAPNWPDHMRLWANNGWQAAMDAHADDEFEIVRRLGFDIVTLSLNESSNSPTPIEIDEWTFKHGNSTKRYHAESGVIEDLMARRMSDDERETSFRNMISADYVPRNIGDDELYVVRRMKNLLADADMDVAIYVSMYVMPVAALPPFALEWFVTEPETLQRFYEKQTLSAVHLAEALVAEGADIVGLGGDFAGDTGSMIAPRAYRDQVLPYIRQQSDAIHKLGAWTTNTTDGVLWDLLPDFLNGAGVDGYGEIDVAAGMELSRLKREWGNSCTFLGNLDIRHVLCSGSIQDAETEMIQCIEDGWGDGGHVIMTSNCVHEDVQPELYRAAIDAYRHYFDLEETEWG